MISFVVLCCLLGDIAITSRVSERAIASILKTEIEDDDVVGDPEWCKSIDPKNCNDAQKTACKQTCGGSAIATAKAAVVTPAREVVKFAAISANMSQRELMVVTKSAEYKRSWPIDCTGKNVLGGLIADSAEEAVAIANGFRCSGGGTVHEINSMAWRLPKAKALEACCKGACVHPKKCGIEAHSFAEGAAATIGRAALKVERFETPTGKPVQVNVEVAPPEKRESTGVVAEVEVRMLGHLEFVPTQPTLTPAGEEYLLELASSLGSLVSMQMAAFPLPEGRTTKVVLCVHAETTATFQDLKTSPANKELGTKLPMARAMEVNTKLQSVLQPGVAALGAPNAHFDQEKAVKAGLPPFVYQSNRRAFILYKMYDSTFSEPPCEHEDLYPFVKKYADRN